MLPKAHRLHGDAVFKALASKGRPFHGRSLSLKVMPQGQDRSVPTRFAFVVSAKVSKKAVVRNLLRRRLREITRKAMPKVKSGLYVLVITRAAATTLSFQELEQEMHGLFTKANIWLGLAK